MGDEYCRGDDSGVAYRDDPWVRKMTGEKYSEFTFMTVTDNVLYGFITSYLMKMLKEMDKDAYEPVSNEGCFSFNAGLDHVKLNPTKDKEDELKAMHDELRRVGKPIPVERYTTKSVGHGEFVISHHGEKIYCINKRKRTCKDCRWDPAVIVLFAEGRGKEDFILEFLDTLVEPRPAKDKDSIAIYRYNRGTWRLAYNARARSLKSVVLPKDMKDKLLIDVEEFMDPQTKTWYLDKGIPYKRSYLFHGVPGSGKTSIITALACAYNKPVCYVSPSEPTMTDENLRNAIISAPLGGIIIFEDVDGLFTKDRVSNVKNYLTFSGLLNSLDGVGSGFGQIFILTTNFRDRLDSALIRNGRVDLQIEFSYVNADQVEAMFGLFYEKADERGKIHFRERVFELVGKVSNKWSLSAATLQNFFITHRKCTFEEAIDMVEDLAEDVRNAIEDNQRRDLERANAIANESAKVVPNLASGGDFDLRPS